MPTYEYACPTCGIVEAFQSMKDAPLRRCPQCRTAKVTRLLSCGAGIIFKGSGFWETDYNRSTDYQTKSKAEGGGSSSTAGSDSTPESKPVTKKKPAKPEAAST